MQVSSASVPRRRQQRVQRYIIYALCDPRGDRPIKYVGQTRNGVIRPQQYHCPSRIVAAANPGLIQWLRELASLGLRHEYEILEELPNRHGLNEAEIFHIAYWRSLGFDLLNMLPGGGVCPKTEWTPERRARHSAVLKGIPHPWLKGKKLSDEHRQKLKESWKGRVLPVRTEEHTINAKAQGARPFTDGKKIFWTKPGAARELGVSLCLVKEVLQGHQSRKLNLWYVDFPTLDIEDKL